MHSVYSNILSTTQGVDTVFKIVLSNTSLEIADINRAVMTKGNSPYLFLVHMVMLLKGSKVLVTMSFHACVPNWI